MLENQTQLDPDTQSLVEAFAPLERDPHGRAPGTPGAKLDAGKNRLGLILYGFPRALEAVGHLSTFGAKKYSPHGWRAVPDGFERYTDALLRHLLAEGRGELLDRDSNLSHAAAVAWNALARLELCLSRVSDARPDIPIMGISEAGDEPRL